MDLYVEKVIEWIEDDVLKKDELDAIIAALKDKIPEKEIDIYDVIDFLKHNRHQISKLKANIDIIDFDDVVDYIGNGITGSESAKIMSLIEADSFDVKTINDEYKIDLLRKLNKICYFEFDLMNALTEKAKEKIKNTFI